MEETTKQVPLRDLMKNMEIKIIFKEKLPYEPFYRKAYITYKGKTRSLSCNLLQYDRVRESTFGHTQLPEVTFHLFLQDMDDFERRWKYDTDMDASYWSGVRYNNQQMRALFGDEIEVINESYYLGLRTFPNLPAIDFTDENYSEREAYQQTEAKLLQCNVEYIEYLYDEFRERDFSLQVNYGVQQPCIDASFYHFCAGTPTAIIEQWFDAHFSTMTIDTAIDPKTGTYRTSRPFFAVVPILDYLRSRYRQ